MDCASLLMEMAVRKYNFYADRINFFVVTSHLVTSPKACAVTLARCEVAFINLRNITSKAYVHLLLSVIVTRIVSLDEL